MYGCDSKKTKKMKGVIVTLARALGIHDWLKSDDRIDFRSCGPQGRHMSKRIVVKIAVKS